MAAAIGPPWRPLSAKGAHFVPSDREDDVKAAEYKSWAMLYWHLRWTISPTGELLQRLEEVGGSF